MECEAVVHLVVIVQVLSYRVDHQSYQIRVLVHQQCQGEVALAALSSATLQLASWSVSLIKHSQSVSRCISHY
jgi:hypothetical protein